MTAQRSPPDSDLSFSAVHAAVAEAYRAFVRHDTAPCPLDVCTACCVAPEIEQQLREWPLGRLLAGHFYEYNSSAKSQIQSPQEVGHFLPRMLELLAKGSEIHHSIELSLDRLGRCPKGSWTQGEEAALARFALAYFESALRKGLRDENGKRRCFDDPLCVLLMFDIGGIAIEPLLDLWLQCAHPFSTVQFVESTYCDFWNHADYSNPFAADRPEFRASIRTWVLDPAHRMQFAAKLMAPDFLALAETRGPFGHTSFCAMVENVFERLTQ